MLASSWQGVKRVASTFLGWICVGPWHSFVAR